MKSYYHILNIHTQATQAQINAAYQARLADWNATDSHNMSRYLEIEEAWENLGDDLRRKWYDESLLREVNAKPNENPSKKNTNISKYTPKSVTIALAGGISLSAIVGFILHFLFLDVLDFGMTQNKIPYLKIDTIVSTKDKDSMNYINIVDTGKAINTNK